MSETGEVCFILAEFLGGPRDGDTAVLRGTAAQNSEVRIPMPERAHLDVLSGPASPWLPGLRIGRYVLTAGAELWLAARLAARLADRPFAEVDAMVRETAPASTYVWEGE